MNYCVRLGTLRPSTRQNALRYIRRLLYRSWVSFRNGREQAVIENCDGPCIIRSSWISTKLLDSGPEAGRVARRGHHRDVAERDQVDSKDFWVYASALPLHRFKRCIKKRGTQRWQSSRS